LARTGSGGGLLWLLLFGGALIVAGLATVAHRARTRSS
jgi:hypothetical protein